MIYWTIVAQFLLFLSCSVQLVLAGGPAGPPSGPTPSQTPCTPNWSICPPDAGPGWNLSSSGSYMLWKQCNYKKNSNTKKCYYSPADGNLVDFFSDDGCKARLGDSNNCPPRPRKRSVPAGKARRSDM